MLARVFAAAVLFAGRPPADLVPIGLFLAPIEEGARIFTPVRLLPFDHPEAEGHEFPNALVLHEREFDVLVRLGHEVGLGLEATLMRYPRSPVREWSYAPFVPPPDLSGETPWAVRKDERPPLPGLRAALFVDGALGAFIVDTRGLSLEQRGLARPTAMGLDLTRAEFLEAIYRAAEGVSAGPLVLVLYGDPPDG